MTGIKDIEYYLSQPLSQLVSRAKAKEEVHIVQLKCNRLIYAMCCNAILPSGANTIVKTIEFPIG